MADKGGKNSSMRKAIAVLFLCAFFPVFASGCGIGVAAAGIGYAIKSNKEADAFQDKSYSDYCVNMTKINADREAKGMKPEHVMTRTEWENSGK